eukprot:355214-Chlamydomonas_euryale.AAC.6
MRVPPSTAVRCPFLPLPATPALFLHSLLPHLPCFSPLPSPPLPQFATPAHDDAHNGAVHGEGDAVAGVAAPAAAAAVAVAAAAAAAAAAVPAAAPTLLASTACSAAHPPPPRRRWHPCLHERWPCVHCLAQSPARPCRLLHAVCQLHVHFLATTDLPSPQSLRVRRPRQRTPRQHCDPRRKKGAARNSPPPSPPPRRGRQRGAAPRVGAAGPTLVAWRLLPREQFPCGLCCRPAHVVRPQGRGEEGRGGGRAGFPLPRAASSGTRVRTCRQNQRQHQLRQHRKQKRPKRRAPRGPRRGPHGKGARVRDDPQCYLYEGQEAPLLLRLLRLRAARSNVAPLAPPRSPAGAAAAASRAGACCVRACVTGGCAAARARPWRVAEIGRGDSPPPVSTRRPRVPCCRCPYRSAARPESDCSFARARARGPTFLSARRPGATGKVLEPRRATPRLTAVRRPIDGHLIVERTRRRRQARRHVQKRGQFPRTKSDAAETEATSRPLDGAGRRCRLGCPAQAAPISELRAMESGAGARRLDVTLGRALGSPSSPPRLSRTGQQVQLPEMWTLR